MLTAPGSGPQCARMHRAGIAPAEDIMSTKMVLATAERAAADPVAVAAALHYASRDAMVPCGACGLPIHRDRSRNANGTLRAGAPVVNGAPVCRSCAPLVAAGDAAAVAPLFRARVATYARVTALWADREAREAK